ncbi:permease prefix domain 1-containing protein [Salibacterium lacus]|uniref:Permease prefix domain 1-containing protein n=1 Tax=Salibacterium lacus TaxID=1898109 RepID=A0ABW5T6A6_9BACI
MKRQIDLDKKIKAFIEREFSGIGTSQQLYELKEELTVNLKERARDLVKEGKSEDAALKEVIHSMGDMSGLKEDMRQIGDDQSKRDVYTSTVSRISTAGFIVGILVMVFGGLATTMLYFMGLPGEAVTGPSIFIVGGGMLFTYSLLTRETTTRYAMIKGRALLYTLAIGITLFSIFVACTSGLATGELFIAISSFIIFFLVGLGLWLGLLFTTKTSRKK